jgi:hypothetical protein
LTRLYHPNADLEKLLRWTGNATADNEAASRKDIEKSFFRVTVPVSYKSVTFFVCMHVLAFCLSYLFISMCTTDPVAHRQYIVENLNNPYLRRHFERSEGETFVHPSDSTANLPSEVLQEIIDAIADIETRTQAFLNNKLVVSPS